MRTTNTYNAYRLWLDAIETRNAANTVIHSVVYGRDAAGRIGALTAGPAGAFGETWLYTYDRLDQLLTATRSGDAASSRKFTGACPPT